MAQPILRSKTEFNNMMRVVNEGDHFWPFKQWPKTQKRYFLKLHLSRSEAYQLFTFLVSNGLQPEIAANYTLGIGVDSNDKWIIKGYSQKRLDDMKANIKEVRSGKYFDYLRRSGKKVWDMSIDHSQYPPGDSGHYVRF